MSRLLQIKNRHGKRSVNTRYLKTILTRMIRQDMDVHDFELGIMLVDTEEMTSVNETFLQHQGSTDVITFDHSEIDNPTDLHGELYVCVDEAQLAAPRFRSTWQDELVRYCIHGFLHLQGHDDRDPASRRQMKRKENQIMRSMRKQFAVDRIERNIRPPE